MLTNLSGGVYLLEIQLLENSKMVIGKLGQFTFHPGYYYYIGTAQKNLSQRLSRHLRKEKKMHWHIDYFLQLADICQIYVWPAAKELECLLTSYILRLPGVQIPVNGFGASDCQCPSHFFYAIYRPHLANLLHLVKTEQDLSGESLF